MSWLRSEIGLSIIDVFKDYCFEAEEAALLRLRLGVRERFLFRSEELDFSLGMILTGGELDLLRRRLLDLLPLLRSQPRDRESDLDDPEELLLL